MSATLKAVYHLEQEWEQTFTEAQVRHALSRNLQDFDEAILSLEADPTKTGASIISSNLTITGVAILHDGKVITKPCAGCGDYRELDLDSLIPKHRGEETGKGAICPGSGKPPMSDEVMEQTK